MNDNSPANQQKSRSGIVVAPTTGYRLVHTRSERVLVADGRRAYARAYDPGCLSGIDRLAGGRESSTEITSTSGWGGVIGRMRKHCRLVGCHFTLVYTSVSAVVIAVIAGVTLL